MLVSLIVPCYNEEESLPILYGALCDVRKQVGDRDFEFIFVNDGSRDKTADVIRGLASDDKDVRYVFFSRNFGKEAAMYAGLEKAKGDYVAILDADMQDPPALIPSMIETLDKDEADIVAARRVTRKGEPPIRSFFARTFYKLINKMCDVEIADGARDFRLMKRCVVDAIISLNERQRFSKGIFAWVGFRTKWVEHENVERVAGETKWSFWKLFRYAIDCSVKICNLLRILLRFPGIPLYRLLLHQSDNLKDLRSGPRLSFAPLLHALHRRTYPYGLRTSG